MNANSPDYTVAKGPGDSMKRNFLLACRESVYRREDEDHQDLAKALALMFLFKVDVNCKVVGDTKYLVKGSHFMMINADEMDSPLDLGYTALHRAVEVFWAPKSFELLQALLAHPDIDVNIKEAEGKTPVMKLLSKSIMPDSFTDYQEYFHMKPSDLTKKYALSTLQKLLQIPSLILDTQDSNDMQLSRAGMLWRSLKCSKMTQG